MTSQSSFGNVGVIPSLALFRGVTGAALPPVVFLQGTTTPNDGGQGFYQVNLTDKTTADNGTSVIVDGGGYRWELVTADTATQIVAALSFGGTLPAIDPLLSGIATVAAAATTNLATVTQAAVSVTGADTITGLGTLGAGRLRWVTFVGINTLTHNATSLILPGGANITTAANDCAVFLSLGSGNWQCISYTEASGGTPGVLPITEGGTGQITAVLAAIALSPKGADIASAATINLAAATGPVVDITGSTGPVTSLGTVAAGARFLLRFASTPTLTYNATSLILPTGANIVAAAGDVALFTSLGSGNWYCAAYQRASGQALAYPTPLSTAITNAGFSIVREYTISGSPHTWTKPTGLKSLRVELFGGGGGGGGGASTTVGNQCSGGGSGGGGGRAYADFIESALAASETITIGAAGAVGAGATADNTAGGNGGAGGATSFGTILKLRAFPGGGGAGGQLAGASGGGGGAGGFGAGGSSTTGTGGAAGGNSGAAGGSGIVGSNASGFGGSGGAGGANGALGATGGTPNGGGAAGGGSGGGIAAVPANTDGGAGGGAWGTYTPASGGSSAAGGAGAQAATGVGPGGGGGGSNASGTGYAGGAGGNGGGGGGGGGSGGNANDGGNGAAGGTGYARVTEFY